MIIESVHLENIRSYSDGTIKFPAGSILLAGDIGCGKSTILLAVDFALFGLRAGELSGAELLRHGKNHGKVTLNLRIGGYAAEILRTLERKKDAVVQSAGYLAVDGVKHDLMGMGLRSFVFDLLGYPANLLRKNKSLLYRYTVYTPQEQMKSILLASQDERLSIIRHVFGIDRYRRLRSNATIVARGLGKKMERLIGLSGGLEDAEKEHAGFIDKGKSIIAEKNETSKKAGELLAEVSEKKKALIELEREKEEHAKSCSQINVLSSKKNMLEKQMALDEKEIIRARMQQKEIFSEDLAAIKEKLCLLETDVSKKAELKNNVLECEKEKELCDGACKTIEVAASKKELLEKKASDLQRNILNAKERQKDLFAEGYDCLCAKIGQLEQDASKKPELKSAISLIEKEMREISSSVTDAGTREKISKDLLERISSMRHCPTCLQEVGETHKKQICEAENGKISKFMKISERIKADLEAVLKKYGGAKKSLEGIEEKERMLSELRAKEKEYARLQKEISANDAETQATKKEIETLCLEAEKCLKVKEKLSSVMESLVAAKKSLEDINEKERELQRLTIGEKEYSRLALGISSKEDAIMRAKKEIDLATGEIDALRNEIEKHAGAGEKYILLRKDIDVLEGELSLKKQHLARLEQQSEDIDSNVASLEKEIAEKKAALVELSKIRALQSWVLDQFSPLMETIERHMMGKIHHEFNSIFREWCGMLIEDDSLSARIDPTFTPLVEQNGFETEFGHLSGGEKTSVALAYRLTLNRVINSLSDMIKTKDILILDEPTDGFSTEQLDKVRDVLRGLALRQIIIVSHEEKMEGFVDNIIRIEKANGESRVVKG